MVLSSTRKKTFVQLFCCSCHRLKCQWMKIMSGNFIYLCCHNFWCFLLVFSHFRHVFCAPLELKCYKEIMHTYFCAPAIYFSHFIFVERWYLYGRFFFLVRGGGCGSIVDDDRSCCLCQLTSLPPIHCVNRTNVTA